jgi:hypothetical protein
MRRANLESMLLLVLLACAASACEPIDTNPVRRGNPIGSAGSESENGGTGGVAAGEGGSASGSEGIGGAPLVPSAGSGGSSGSSAGMADGGSAGPTGMQIFLLFGQSNMEGVPQPEAADRVEDPRVEVLGYTNCGLRQYNEWYVASPPLHSCYLGVGPGDYFAKAMAEAWPDAEIGLVPAAIAGVDIDFFRKGVTSARRAEFSIPPDNTRDSAYDMLLEKAQIAQERGTIRGILFHHGETDSGQSVWLSKVAEIVEDLRTDLGLGEDVPFVAGELLYTGCCSAHNSLVNQLPNNVPNSHVVSASGLAGVDSSHFDLPGQRELGARYAEAMLEALATP